MLDRYGYSLGKGFIIYTYPPKTADNIRGRKGFDRGFEQPEASRGAVPL